VVRNRVTAIARERIRYTGPDPVVANPPVRPQD